MKHALSYRSIYKLFSLFLLISLVFLNFNTSETALVYAKESPRQMSAMKNILNVIDPEQARESLVTFINETGFPYVEWRSSNILDPTTYFDLNGVPSAYVFEFKNEEDYLGFMTINARTSTVMHYSPSDPPHHYVESIRKIAEGQVGLLKGGETYLSFGPMSYYVQFTKDIDGRSVFFALNPDLSKVSKINSREVLEPLQTKFEDYSNRKIQQLNNGQRFHAINAASEKVLLTEKGYIWTRGCASTTSAMLLNYWGLHGWPSLRHEPSFYDWDGPMNEWNPRWGAKDLIDHFADYFGLPTSGPGEYYATVGDIGGAYETVARNHGVTAFTSWQPYPSYSNYVSEIDDGRPVHVHFDSGTYSEHDVFGVGYRITSTTNEIAVYNTYKSAYEWADFNTLNNQLWLIALGGVDNIQADNLILNSWGNVEVAVVAPWTGDYKVRIWDDDGVSSPKWDWGGAESGIVSLNAGERYTFHFTTRPNTTNETFEFWLYHQDFLGLYKIIQKIEHPLTISNNDRVRIPAGSFLMGSLSTDPYSPWSGEIPRHTVNLSQYYIDKTEVTNEMYRNCDNNGPCTSPSNASSPTRSSYYGNPAYDKYPVIYVNWSQAKTYCEWSGGRLPTEAEWERAARGTDARYFPWGNATPSCSLANYGNCVGDTRPVGSYPAGASQDGLLDMAGNVYEWVSDWMSSTYYSSSPAGNPQGPASGTDHVIRGGEWSTPAIRDIRVVSRGGANPATSNATIGFRCAYSSAPITYSISGNAGAASATLSYTDGMPKTAISDSNGNYSIAVPAGWSGTVTPSKPNCLFTFACVFTPGSRSYTNLQSNQTEQNYRTLILGLPGQGADTTGVFRPSNGLLYLKNTNDTGFADIAINYGIPGDYPVVGDWDGDGTVTIGVYRNGQFMLRNSNTIGFADMVFAFGTPGDQPIAGDWDGDGMDTVGVYRPWTGQFLLRNSNSAGAAEMSFYLGNVGDVGIAGDWDGDGKDTTGVFRPVNGIIFLKNQNTTGFADVALNYGIPGDKPVTGDWDDDGIDTIGVYRNGQFMLRNSNTLGFADIVFGLGNPGDMPIAGNWDGLP